MIANIDCPNCRTVMKTIDGKIWCISCDCQGIITLSTTGINQSITFQYPVINTEEADGQ